MRRPLPPSNRPLKAGLARYRGGMSRFTAPAYKLPEASRLRIAGKTGRMKPEDQRQIFAPGLRTRQPRAARAGGAFKTANPGDVPHAARATH